MSFAAIASRLGMARSRDAYESFLRALNATPDSEQPELIQQELVRLNELEERIRSRDTQPEKMDRRLQGLERMRERLTKSRPAS